MAAKKLSCCREWEGLQSIARICRERRDGDKVEQGEMYYITSLPPNSPMIQAAAREHWGVEMFHWRLDVAFKQDNSRYRNEVGARNLAVIRKFALQALLKETSIKGGVATKQCAAACNPSYRAKVVANLVNLTAH